MHMAQATQSALSQVLMHISYMLYTNAYELYVHILMLVYLCLLATQLFSIGNFVYAAFLGVSA